METITLSSKFQLVIPKKTRLGLGWRPGDRIVAIEKGSSLELVRIGDIAKAEGIAKGATSKNLREHGERF